jgi:hypothetical protein
MGIILAGGELDVFNAVNANTIETTAGGTFGAGARCSIKMGNGNFGLGSGFASEVFTAINQFWLHFEMSIESGAVAAQEFLYFTNAANQVVFKAVHLNAVNQLQFQYWDGSAFVNIGPIWGFFGLNTVYKFNLELDLIAGTFNFYNNAVLVASGSGITASARNPVKFNLCNLGLGGFSAYASKIFMDTEDTRNSDLITCAANGDGFNTAWTGTYTDINEIAVNDATFISSNTTGQKETFTIATPSIGINNIKAVVLGCRSNRSGAGPQNIEPVLRLSGTDYIGSVFATDANINSQSIVIGVNPATGNLWQNSEVTSANFEYGYRSAA